MVAPASVPASDEYECRHGQHSSTERTTQLRRSIEHCSPPTISGLADACRRKMPAGTPALLTARRVYNSLEIDFATETESVSPLRKPKKFRAAKEARRRARIAIGTPQTERVIPDKRKKPPKHRKKLIEEALE